MYLLYFFKVKELEPHKDKSTLGEAEKFLYAVSKVKRYEARINCMIYIGTFDDTVKTVKPVSILTAYLNDRIDNILALICNSFYLFVQQIEAVSKAALSIMRSSRLKKVFEVYLYKKFEFFF